MQKNSRLKIIQMIGLSLLVSFCTYIAALCEFDVLNYSREKNPNSWTNLMIIVLGNSNVASKLRLYSQVCRSFLGKLDLFLHKYFAHNVALCANSNFEVFQMFI